MQLNRPTPEMMDAARKWLYIMETHTDDEIDRQWHNFDQWFEASEIHRKAYAQARRRWQELTGQAPDPPPPLRYRIQRWVARVRGWKTIAHDPLWPLIVAMAMLTLVVTLSSLEHASGNSSPAAQHSSHNAHHR
jgi:ferric-dicitrate binding protein FerR (iron transport regulator)